MGKGSFLVLPVGHAGCSEGYVHQSSPPPSGLPDSISMSVPLPIFTLPPLDQELSSEASLINSKVFCL